jgi:hypothetical protein
VVKLVNMTTETNGIVGTGASAPDGPWDPGGEHWQERQDQRREEKLEYIRSFDGHPERPAHGIEKYDRDKLGERIVQRVIRDGVRTGERWPRQTHTAYTLDIQGPVSETKVAIRVKYETDTYLNSAGEADGYGDSLVVTDTASNETMFERKGGTVTTNKEGPWQELFPLL